MSIYKRITTLGIYLLLLTNPIHEIYVFPARCKKYLRDIITIASIRARNFACLFAEELNRGVLSGGGEWSDAL